MKEMIVGFPGGLKIDAHYKGFTIRTDQPETQGGSGSAPSPLDLFLASIGCCSGFYVVSFCNERDIPTNGIDVVVTMERDKKTRLVERIRIEVRLPRTFPGKYKNAIIKAIDQCTVKKAVESAPDFIVTTRDV